MTGRIGAALVGVAALLVAGCGDGRGAEATATATVAAPTATVAPPPPAAPRSTSTASAAPSGDCRTRRGLRLAIVAGGATCADLRSVAAAFELRGAKVQQRRGWTCATGTADTRPIVFTCTRGAAEFTASEAG